uniref:Ankyrin repeat domain 52a n=2 Tax=Scleropages formosus TaxID=113540 RepID=A0A8C9U6X0_SCLFO
MQLFFKKEDQERRTPLHAAACLGDVHIMDLLINSGASVNAKDHVWLTPLHRAAASRNERAVGLLLRQGAEVNARDKYWQTPLHVAAANRATRCAEALLPQLSSLNVADRTGRTALHHATYSGYLEMVKLLLNKGANLSASDKKERQPIHWAAYLGHLEIVKLLVSRSADAVCKDKRGYTPLHAAAASGQIEVVKYLLRLGIDEPNAFGNTALHVACYMGQEAVANELVNRGANVNQPNLRGYTPLHLAAVSTNGALCLELLVNNGADVNMQSKDGKSPLHMAAIHGRFTRSQILIQNGGEIDCVDKYGNTPLHVAAKYGHELLISTLMTNGADTARQGIHGMFPLHLAVLYGFSDCCRKLLSSAGFDINTPDNLGRTCLHAAASGGNVECLNLLLSSGADLGKKDKLGRTPLHYAAANGSYQCAVALVSAGAEVNEPDGKGCTPLHYAAYNGHCEALRVLAETLVNLDVRDTGGRTALHLAAQRGHCRCVEVLLGHGASCLIKERRRKWTPLHMAGSVCSHTHELRRVRVIIPSVCARADPSTLQVRLPHCVLDNLGFSLAVSDQIYIHNHIHLCFQLPVATQTVCSECPPVLCVILFGFLQPLTFHCCSPRTPLMLAVLGSHTGCVHVLLERGATADAGDKRGRTALHRAAVMGCEDCVLALLEHDAYVMCRDFQGRTPMHLAASCGHAELLGSLLQASARTDPLDSLLDYSGYTPLHWAAYHGHEDCLEVLLEHKPFSIQEGNPFTPLHCALMNGHDGSAELLLETVGSQLVNVRDMKGRSPLHAAAFVDNVAGLQLLLRHGAEVDAVDHAGCSALMVAADNGQTAAVEILLHRAKATLSLLDINKNTALHLACSKVRIPLFPSAHCLLYVCVQALCFTRVTSHRPLHIAARNGLATVVQALLSRGATVLAVDQEGHTPALACAPNKDVADCLALILSTMNGMAPSGWTAASPSEAPPNLPLPHNSPTSLSPRRRDWVNPLQHTLDEQEYIYTRLCVFKQL